MISTDAKRATIVLQGNVLASANAAAGVQIPLRGAVRYVQESDPREAPLPAPQRG